MRSFALCILLTLSACATTLTWNEKISIAYGSLDTIAKTTDQLLQAGKITSSEAGVIAKDLQYLSTALSAAQTVYQTNSTDGGNALQTALTAISTIEGCLSSPSNLSTCVPTLGN